MNYLMWRVLTGRHSSITYFFLVVGHTKFSPDWCFGLFKRLFKRTLVSSISEIAGVVERSASCNVAQIVHTEEKEVVPTRDWVSFLLPNFKRINGIKTFHHFRFCNTSLGTVFVSDVQVCHQRKDTTLMVFDLILSPTLNLALSPSPMNTVIS